MFIQEAAMFMNRNFLLKVGLGLLLGAGWASPAAIAASPGNPSASSDNDQPACFLRRDWDGGFRVTPDSKTVYIRVSHHWIYRLDLAAPSPLLQSAFAILNNRGTNDSICSPLDFRLVVSDRTGAQEPSIVSKLTRLTDEEAKALPKKLLP
jgi:hypothetical protein